MNKPLLDKSSGQGYLPTPSYGKKIKRLTKVKVNINDDPQLAKRYRVKNPKWAQFIHTIEYQNQNTFSSFKALKWCKSLQVTSIHVNGFQCGGTVGHFHGELKHLAKCARYLKTLDFEAGIMTKKRFLDYRRWLMRQKYLTNLSFVPFWFPVEKQEDVLDWDVVRTKGVVSLLHSLRAQIRELTLHGFTQRDLVKKLEMKEFSQLRNFAIQAASRPGGYFDGPEEFSELHLDFVKKVLECKNLESIGLKSENDSTDKEIWKSLKEMILPVKKPLTVDIEVDERKKKIHEWFKKNFADLPAHLKVTYSIWSTGYFLSMPDGKEDVGQNDDDEFDDDSEDEDEDEDDEDKEDKDEDGDGGEKDENDDGMEEEEKEKEEDDENGDEDEEENEDDDE